MSEKTAKRLHFWLIIFFVCLLFTFKLWDHYYNSANPMDRSVVANIILAMGILFSVAAALFSWSLETHRDRLETVVEERTEQLTLRNRELENALKEIKTLQGLVPICAACKKVRDDKGFWHEVEVYVSRHSGAKFTHGICKECKERLYKDFGKNSKTSSPEKTETA